VALTDLSIAMKLVRLITVCSEEVYIEVRIGKILSYTFASQNGLKHGDHLCPLFFNFSSEYAIWKVEENQEG